jgi:hypothetical protein
VGGNFDVRVYAGEDRAEVARKFAADQDASRRESGESYSGEIGVMPRGIASWHDRRFASQVEAENFLSERHQKWAPAQAVSFLLPAKPSAERVAQLAAARGVADSAADALRLTEARVLTELRVNGRGDFATCPGDGCGSKLRRSKLVTRACPLCTADLATATQRAALATARLSLAAARAKVVDLVKPEPSTKIAWIVGGWCSS